MEKSTESKPRLRADHLLLCVLLAALTLSASVVVPYTGLSNFGMPEKGASANTLHHSSLRPLHEPALILKPFQAVNVSGATNQPVQVGAWGDAASVGNSGVQVEIRTNDYNVSSQDDAFWVGDVLSDGSFVQFGYLMMPPGYYCLNAHVTQAGTSCLGGSDNIAPSDARWFWAYFPNSQIVTDWYYGFGAANSAGSNGTWHLYSILPSESSNWSFVVDGVTIYSSNFPSSTSTSPAHLVAEMASGPYLSQLGPVEFRDLAYLGSDDLWYPTSSLSLIDGCGAADTGPCSISNAYGIQPVGANDVVAGSYASLSALASGQILWERESACTLGTTLSTSAAAGYAPLNVTFTDAVSSPQGNFRTDWWFGDGSHESGDLNQTVTYGTPGNYTPLVRVSDSAGCLSEVTGQVSVAATNGSTFGASTAGASVSVGEFTLCAVSPRDSYAPCQ